MRLVLVSLIISSHPAFAMDCAAFANLTKVSEIFLQRVTENSSSETFYDDPLLWLETRMSLQKQQTNTLDRLKECVASGYGYDQPECRVVLSEVSDELFQIEEELRIALACRFKDKTVLQGEHVSALLNRCNLFHRQLLQSAHSFDWRRAMQESEQKIKEQP